MYVCMNECTGNGYSFECKQNKLYFVRVIFSSFVETICLAQFNHNNKSKKGKNKKFYGETISSAQIQMTSNREKKEIIHYVL